jgi:putative restriction endonuclease
MKVGNIGRLDPDLRSQGIVGLNHGSKMDAEVWREFYGNRDYLAFESERLLAEYSQKSINDIADVSGDFPCGEERLVQIKQRVNQSFFRSVVMSSYNFKCCVSGLSVPELLEACHIVEWSEDEKNRTNPKNGLCMNPFFHRAYDKHLMAITPDCSVLISEELLGNVSENSFYVYLKEIHGKKIVMPDRFLPDRDLLETHYSKYKERV